MTFNVLTIRTAEFDDGSLYPVLGDEKNELEFEPQDGTDILQLFATGVSVTRVVGNSTDEVVAANDLTISVYVTDARVAIACTKYDKGGGWRGTSLAVPVLNLASMARAAHRRKGKMLVGHLRYPWIKSVGFTEKTGWLTNAGLRFAYQEKIDGVTHSAFFDITFSKGVDVSEIAAVITRRCARYRLRTDETMTPEKQQAFDRLAQATKLPGVEKKYVNHQMPTNYFVNKASAYPRVVADRAGVAAPVAPVQLPMPAVSVVDVQPPITTAGFAPPSVPLGQPNAVQPVVAPPVVVQPVVVQPEVHPARWADDPYGRHEQRYWDGARWTEHVADQGIAGTDPWPR